MAGNCIQVMRALTHNNRVFSRFFSRDVLSLTYQYHPLLQFDVQKKWQKTHKIDSSACSQLFNSKCFVRNNHMVQIRGLDWEAKEEDIVNFFKPLSITPSKIHLKCDISGRTSKACEVEFATHAEVQVAMCKRNAFIGNRFIHLSSESTLNVQNELPESDIQETKTQSKHGYLSTPKHFIRIGNFPKRITEQAIFQFFWPLSVRPISMQPVYDENGFQSGEFDVEFLSHEDALKAMTKNNTFIGHRFVEFTLYSDDVSSVAGPSAYGSTTMNAKHPSDCEQTKM